MTGRPKTRERSLSIVIPAYNEESRLPPTLLKIHDFLTARAYDAEIIVVDDGSRDRTTERVSALQPHLPLLRLQTHRTNTGKDFAVFTGIKLATRRAVLFTDADLSTPIEDVERLWGAYDRGWQVVIGSRRLPSSEIPVPQPLHRRAMGRVFSGMVSLLCLRGIRDTQCGFKLFGTEAIRRILPLVRTQGFAFDVEILMRARSLGYRIAEVGVRWNDAADSRIRPFKDSTRMFLQLLRMRGLL
jgi:dolichyl-phosphate beta-glucosyltransferase